MNKIPFSKLANLGILIVCALALYKLFPVVVRQWQGVEACPAIGFLPACYLVFFGYITIAVSVAIRPLRSGWVFLLGWLPVFFLAFTGTSLELLVQPTCPRNASDTPMCFYSLAVASVLFATYIFARRTSPVLAKSSLESTDLKE